MKSTPLTVCAALIPPILDGRKTQTRRIINPQPTTFVWLAGRNGNPSERVNTGAWDWRCTNHNHKCLGTSWNIIERELLAYGAKKYGQPGDQLWVREEHYQYGHWEIVPGIKTPTGRQKWKFVQDVDDTLFYAPPTFSRAMPRVHPEIPAWYKRLARFMPHRVSRITLEITEIRVERVQDISEDDAKAEGCPPVVHEDGSVDCGTRKTMFAKLWNRINSDRGHSWESNPYVWAITFRKL